MRKLIYTSVLALLPLLTFAQQVISGNINLPNGTPICDVIVELVDANGQVVAQDLSDADGLFAFAEGEEGNDYSLHFSREQNAMNGTTTFDIVLAFRAILGIDPLTPYMLWAADVNGSGQVTTLDMVFMRRLILALDESFPISSWAFDEADTIVPDNTIEVSALSGSPIFSVIGVKRGDLNQSAATGCQ